MLELDCTCSLSSAFKIYGCSGFAAVFYKWFFVGFITWGRVADASGAKEDEDEECYC